MPTLKKPKINSFGLASFDSGPSITERLEAAQYTFPSRPKVAMLQMLQIRENVCSVLFSLLWFSSSDRGEAWSFPV